MLRVENTDAHYGNAQALFGISLHVEKGEIVTVLGANGAGKTTTLSTVSGLVEPSAGTTSFMGEEISGVSPDVIVQKGISHCPEGRRIFSRMTVNENLEMGAYTCKDGNEMKSRLDQVFKRFSILEERRNQLAGTLSGGEQQMLAIGRALMSNPKLIMFDEPSAGLAPFLVARIAEIIRDIRLQGTTVILVEQNARVALELADRAYILENGRIALHGRTEDLLEDEKVQKVYLGAGNSR